MYVREKVSGVLSRADSSILISQSRRIPGSDLIANQIKPNLLIIDLKTLGDNESRLDDIRKENPEVKIILFLEDTEKDAAAYINETFNFKIDAVFYPPNLIFEVMRILMEHKRD